MGIYFNTDAKAKTQVDVRTSSNSFADIMEPLKESNYDSAIKMLEDRKEELFGLTFEQRATIDFATTNGRNYQMYQREGQKLLWTHSDGTVAVTNAWSEQRIDTHISDKTLQYYFESKFVSINILTYQDQDGDLVACVLFPKK